jgi:hypothetical protein
LSVLAANIERALQKCMPFHQYLKEYYHSLVKEECDQCYTFAKEKYNNTTEEERTREKMKKPAAFQMRLDISREFWLLESQKFHDMVAKDAEDANAKEIEECGVIEDCTKNSSTIPSVSNNYVSNRTTHLINHPDSLHLQGNIFTRLPKPSCLRCRLLF